MSGKATLNQKERRDAILNAAVRVFSRKGFHAGTLRELAEQAQVSEALLYRHFPGKQELYQAVGEHLMQSQMGDATIQERLQQPPSTERLVTVLRLFLKNFVVRSEAALIRMVAWSLLEDGDFARALVAAVKDLLEQTLAQDLACAYSDGALRFPCECGNHALWFTDHIGFAMTLWRLPDPAITVSDCDFDEQIRLALRFCLRGMGMDETIIDRFAPLSKDQQIHG